MHDKRRYVKLKRKRRGTLVVLPLALLLLGMPGRARAELLYPGQVDDARFAAGTAGTTVGYAVGATVELRTRGSRGWTSSGTVSFRSTPTIDGLARLPSGRVAVLARGRDGSWLQLRDGRRKWSIHRDSLQARFGPAGLTLDRSGRPVVAYALWFPSGRTFLRLGRIRTNGKLTIQRLTRKGFPPSAAPPAAAPVVLGSGEIRVVETYIPAGIEWRFEDGDWWGKLLHSSARGFPVGRIAAVAAGSTVYAAWTEAFPTLAPPGIVLATRSDRARSVIALDDASLAALAVTRTGPELAANRCIPALAFGLEGEGVCGGLVTGAGVDGTVADYTVGSTRQLLLRTPDGLQWFTSPTPLTERVAFGTDFTGRVAGATGGAIAIYRELPGERTLFTQVPLAADGTFSLAAPAGPIAAAYRAVYTDPATGIPYAALVGP
jgi:hypothetical protein